MKKVPSRETDNALHSLEAKMTSQTDDFWNSAIEQGIAQADRGELIDHATVEAKWKGRLAKLSSLSDWST